MGVLKFKLDLNVPLWPRAEERYLIRTYSMELLSDWLRSPSSEHQWESQTHWIHGLPNKLISICLVWYFEHFSKIFESLWSKWNKRKIISIMWRCFSTSSCWKFDRFFAIEIFYVILYLYHSLQGPAIREHKYRPRGKL